MAMALPGCPEVMAMARPMVTVARPTLPVALVDPTAPLAALVDPMALPVVLADPTVPLVGRLARQMDTPAPPSQLAAGTPLLSTPGPASCGKPSRVAQGNEG
jgi:hypothetical protein